MARTNQQFNRAVAAQRVDESTKKCWIFDSRGKRTEATVEDARGMITGEGFSALYPRGTPEEEQYEMDMLAQDTSMADAIVRAQKPRATRANAAQITSLDQEQFRHSSFTSGAEE